MIRSRSLRRLQVSLHQDSDNPHVDRVVSPILQVIQVDQEQRQRRQSLLTVHDKALTSFMANNNRSLRGPMLIS